MTSGHRSRAASPADHGGRLTEDQPVGGASPGPDDHDVLTRWRVHLWLMISVAGALAALVVFRGTTVHIVVGLGFFALVLVHVAQRRRTAGRLVAHLGHARQWASRPGRRALSDVLLGLLTLNLLVSGLADWLAGHTILLPVAALGWHVAAAVALLADASVHVLRRRRRLRTSHIR